MFWLVLHDWSLYFFVFWLVLELVMPCVFFGVLYTSLIPHTLVYGLCRGECSVFLFVEVVLLCIISYLMHPFDRG